MSSVQPEIAINGMAHVILTVSQFDKAHAFYSGLLPKFGMTCVHDGPDFCYHVGARTAIGIRKCDPEFTNESFQQYRVGLHHLCLRARSREDVDKTAALAAELGATIVRGPEERDWAKGYYYVLFEDPDGIRLEVNFIPGSGLLKKDEGFGSGDDYVRVDGQDLTGTS
jgi:catechol 2,3-dioxygenase-like lactoylglutathione lyase family enzyme|tara:strand:- start:1063 stop:1566 length:504 start_codon:yes stop_codon:yes gene_type:complete